MISPVQNVARNLFYALNNSKPIHKIKNCIVLNITYLYKSAFVCDEHNAYTFNLILVWKIIKVKICILLTVIIICSNYDASLTMFKNFIDCIIIEYTCGVVKSVIFCCYRNKLLIESSIKLLFS